jgi:hypothetical protein
MSDAEPIPVIAAPSASADALMLSRIQELRNGGGSFRAIAEALNDAGQVTRTGSTWSARLVQRVVTEPSRTNQAFAAGRFNRVPSTWQREPRRP